MAGSGMRFSRSGPPGARRRCPTHSAEPPEHAETPRPAQQPVQRSLFAGCHPLGGWHDKERPQHAHDARAERAGRVWVGTATPYSSNQVSSSLPAIVYAEASMKPLWRAGRRIQGTRARQRPRGWRDEHDAGLCHR